MPDLLNLDYELFGVALVIAFGAVMLSRYLWNRVGREDGRKAQMYSPREFITDLREARRDHDWIEAEMALPADFRRSDED